jgi:hypothetical protein
LDPISYTLNPKPFTLNAKPRLESVRHVYESWCDGRIEHEPTETIWYSELMAENQRWSPPPGAWYGTMRDVTEQEVRDSFAGGGKCSAPGPSGITRETWLATPDVISALLVGVLNDVLKSGN